jgi:hypothetical protein
MEKDKVFLALIVFLNLVLDKGRYFERTKKKCEDFCTDNRELSKLAVGYSMFYLYTRDHTVSIIGTLILFLLEDSIIP